MADAIRPQKRDGLGDAIVAGADYYVQDKRQFVGNCVLWWGPDNQGYVCELDKAGVYKGADITDLRDTDVPWPVDVVRASVVQHVRAEGLQRAVRARQQSEPAPPAAPPREMRRASDGTLHKVVEHYGIAGYEVRWTEECTGCTEREDGHLVSGPTGCSECGHTGKRRRVAWVPFDPDDQALVDAAIAAGACDACEDGIQRRSDDNGEDIETPCDECHGQGSGATT